MTYEDLAKIKAAFNAYAQRSPEPDTPVIFWGDKALSVKAIAHEIEKETETGRVFVNMFERMVEHSGKSLDENVARLMGPKR